MIPAADCQHFLFCFHFNGVIRRFVRQNELELAFAYFQLPAAQLLPRIRG